MVSKISIRIDMYRYFQNMYPFFDIFKIAIRIEKCWRKMGNTLNRFLDILFLGQFLEKLVKNYPKNRKLFWENFEIIWKNYKIIILGTFQKFWGKYLRQVSFVKQILNYLLGTLIFRILKKYRYIVVRSDIFVENIIHIELKIFRYWHH